MWHKVGVDGKTTRSYSSWSHRPPSPNASGKHHSAIPQKQKERDGRFHPFQKFDAPQTVSKPMSRSEEYCLLLNTKNIYFATLLYYVGPTNTGINDQWEKEIWTLRVTFNSNTWFAIQQPPRHPNAPLSWTIFFFSRTNTIFSWNIDE